MTSAISTLVDEATFEATTEGLSFRGMDPSHVALIDISWPNSAFDAYESDSALKFGVRIDEFSKLIKRADKKDLVEISIGDDSMLHVRISNGYVRGYKMRLIEKYCKFYPTTQVNFQF